MTGVFWPADGVARHLEASTTSEAFAFAESRRAVRVAWLGEHYRRLAGEWVSLGASPIQEFARALDLAPKVAEAPFALTAELRDVRGVQSGLFNGNRPESTEPWLDSTNGKRG